MLSQRLRAIRMEHNLTQRNIADVLGVDRTTYTLYETGATSPSPDTLYKLSRMYDVTVGYLMGVEENYPVRRPNATPGQAAISAGVDPIAVLRPEEKQLLLCFRVLDGETKRQALELLAKMAKETESI
jgi:transcriptional regulator with XRE-family HTH domain